MALDAITNFGYATLATGIDSDDTSISLTTGHGARLPSTAFNAVIWDTSYSSPVAAYHASAGEIVRVTARSTDTLTVTRAQEGTTARNFNASGKTYAIAQTFTKRAFEELPQSARLPIVTATAHGFVAGDVLKLSGTTWSKAIATSVANATAIAVVESATTDTFVPVLAGRITLSGLTAGIYYLSDATAGLLTLTAPTTSSSYLVPVLRAVSATDAYVDIGSPLTLSAITSSDISDFNSATRAQVEAELVAGTNVTLTPSGTGASRQITIAATGGGGAGDVTAAAAIADNAIVRGDGGAKGVQSSGASITDAGDLEISSDGIPGSFSLGDAQDPPVFIHHSAPAAVSTEYTLSWPAAAPTAGQALVVDSVTGSVVQLKGSTVSAGDGDKGDITVSASGATWTIDNDAVTYAKIQNVSATDRLLGRSTAGAGDIEEITCTAAGRALLALDTPTHYFYNTILPDFDGVLRWWHVPQESMTGVNSNGTIVTGWQGAVNGSGAAAYFEFPSATPPTGMRHPYAYAECGTTTTGGVKVYWRSSNNVVENRGAYKLSEWSFVELETYVKINALSDGTDTYSFRFGLMPNTTNASTAPAFGCFIELNSAASVVARVGSVDTASSTTAITGDTAYRLRLRLDVAAGTVQGWIDSTSIGTVSSGLPDLATNAGMTAASWFIKSAGTNTRYLALMPIVWKLR